MNISSAVHPETKGVYTFKVVPLVLLDNSAQTVVSFDQGGEWLPVQKPVNSICDSTAKDPEKVNIEPCEGAGLRESRIRMQEETET